MSSITETAQIIANMAQTHITDAIISAVKGKAPSQMKLKKSNKKIESLSCRRNSCVFQYARIC
jgi:flavoprotein